jgi:cadmium resistance protein CadD (predicted permease)
MSEMDKLRFIELMILSIFTVILGTTMILLAGFGYAPMIRDGIIYLNWILGLFGLVLIFLGIFNYSFAWESYFSSEQPLESTLYEKADMIYCSNCGVKLRDE